MCTTDSKIRPGCKVFAGKALNCQADARGFLRRWCRVLVSCPELHLGIEHVIVQGHTINDLLPAGRKGALYDCVHGLGPRVCRARQMGSQPQLWLALGRGRRNSSQWQWQAMYKQQLNTGRVTVVAWQRACQAQVLFAGLFKGHSSCHPAQDRSSPSGAAMLARVRMRCTSWSSPITFFTPEVMSAVRATAAAAPSG